VHALRLTPVVGAEGTVCYGVYISTDSGEDLAGRSSNLVRFEKVAAPEADPCISLLEFSSQWSVGSKSGCGCTFRHLTSIDLGFSEPVEWYEEGQDELDATQELYGVLRSLLEAGYKVDLVDRWEGSEPDDITTMAVSLDRVSVREFRLFEDYKFKLTTKEKQRPQGL